MNNKMEWLGGIAGGVLTGLAVTWLSGFLNRFVPSPRRSWLAVRNFLQTKTRRPEDRFRFVLCWLEGGYRRQGYERRVSSIQQR